MDDPSTSAARHPDSPTSPTTSPDHCSSPAASDPDYTLDCEEPVSWASAPEFGELPGKGSALVVTGSSGGRTRRQIHQIAAECVAGAAVREDGFDSAAAGA